MVDTKRLPKNSADQENGSGTTSTETVLFGSEAKFSVADAASPPDGLAAASLVAALLKPRFTYPSAISFPILSLRVALVIQPTSFPGAEGETSFIPGGRGIYDTEIQRH